MYRGTTPTFEFTLPFAAATIDILSIAFSQDQKLVLEKEKSDCTFSGTKITCELSEEDTLLFNSEFPIVEIQIRVGIGESRMASKIMKTKVQRILRDGVLDDSI